MAPGPPALGEAVNQQDQRMIGLGGVGWRGSLGSRHGDVKAGVPCREVTVGPKAGAFDDDGHTRSLSAVRGAGGGSVLMS